MDVNQLQKLHKAFPSLIPLKGKRPFKNDWQQWCEKPGPFNPKDFEHYNAGIPCGPVNGIIVVDVDDVIGFQKWLSAHNYELPKTRTHMTGSDKPHYLYKYPENGHRYGNRKPDSSFDVRGVGGQVVAPGSIHPRTGKFYRLLHELPIAPAPQWLLKLAIQEEQQTTPRGQQKITGNADIARLPIGFATKKLIKEGERKGERSEAIGSVLAALIRVRVPENAIYKIFDTYPIGEKYREKGNSRHRWLQGEISRLRRFVREKQETVSPEDPLEFPKEVMSGPAGNFARLYSSYLEVPDVFFFMGYLTCLGIFTADRLTLASEIAPQPRLYVVLLGASADDRKSTCLVKTTDFFKDALGDFPVCYGVGSAEGLQKRLQKSGQLLLCFDEFKSFVSKSKIDTSVLLPCVNTLFESNRYEARTKQHDICLENAYLSLLAASTVETYERIWDSSFTDIGFNNRLFLVPGSGERKFSFPAKIPANEKESCVRNLGQVLKHIGNGREFGIAPAARRIYDDWYMNLTSSVHTKRLDTYALRLMALLTANDLETEINERIVHNAIALANWQYKVRQQHDPIDADTKTAKMEEKIRRALSGKVLNDRNLKRRVNAHRAGLWIYESAKRNLNTAREIRWNKKMDGWERVQ